VISGVVVGPNEPIDLLHVASGGTIVSTELLSGGFVDVDSGAVAIDTIFSGNSFSRGLENVYGLDSGAQIFGGLQIVDSGGEAIGATISAFGGQTVSSGGLASGTTVSSGGELVLSGGTAERHDREPGWH
jgi:autotransporter passenger strand-loop-strand repeat protein